MWEEKISSERSMGTSHFQLVYGKEVIFHIKLGLPVMKLLENKEEEPNNMIHRLI